MLTWWFWLVRFHSMTTLRFFSKSLVSFTLLGKDAQHGFASFITHSVCKKGEHTSYFTQKVSLKGMISSHIRSKSCFGYFSLLTFIY
jgi:hypothetical protein